MPTVPYEPQEHRTGANLLSNIGPLILPSVQNRAPKVFIDVTVYWEINPPQSRHSRMIAGPRVVMKRVLYKYNSIHHGV